jgi:predicted ribosome quality control (RQC) complex YloA/Tae2 family protein
MNYSILTQVVDELSRALPGAKVDRIYPTAQSGVCFVLHRPRKNLLLLLAADRALPRLHLLTAKPVAADTVSPFVLFLRSRLAGLRLAKVGIVNDDRVVTFTFHGQDDDYRLICELTGASANMLLTDQADTILSVLYPVPLSNENARLLMPGISYVPPEKKPPRGGRAADREAGGRTDGPSPVPAEGAEFPLNRGTEIFFEQRMRDRESSALQTRLRSLVRRSLAKAGRRVEALTRDRAHGERAEEYRTKGSLLLANLASVERKADSIRLNDYRGNLVDITLDPRLSPTRNADAYFKRYKKAKAGLGIIQDRLAQSRAEEAALHELLARVENASGIEDLRDVEHELARRGYSGGGSKKEVKEHAGVSLPGIRKFLFQGWEILVGRSAAGNDALTMKLARPEDLWLHAEGMPGSHVLVRNPGRGDVPPVVLARAASLAALYSKGKSAAKVPVLYTRAKYVRKPKGARPGAVTVSERKTIVAVPAAE